MLLDMSKSGSTSVNDKLTKSNVIRGSSSIGGVGGNDNDERLSSTDPDRSSTTTTASSNNSNAIETHRNRDNHARSKTSLEEDENEEVTLEDGKLIESSSGSDNTTCNAKGAELNDDDDDEQHHKIIENLKLKQSMSANKKFQRLFGGKIQESNERLVSVFRCALLRNNRHLLLQGMLYVTRKHFAFHSNIFGFQTLEHEKWADIKEIKKENIALLFPTAISFTTHTDKKYFFASFLARNQAFKILTKLWHHHSHYPDENNNGASLDVNGTRPDTGGLKSIEMAGSAEPSRTAKEDSGPPASRASSTSMSSMSSSLESIEVAPAHEAEPFMDSCHRDDAAAADDDDYFPLDDDSEFNSSSLNDMDSTTDSAFASKQPSSFMNKMTSSMANLAQSLVYFFILNRVNMFFFEKIQLFILYLLFNRSFNQQQSYPRRTSSESSRDAKGNTLPNGTFLSSRYIKFRSFRIHYSELLILVTFLVVVGIIYVYIFLILLKVNAIETKLADLYEKLKSF